MEKLKIAEAQEELFIIRDIRSADQDSYRERRTYDGNVKPNKPEFARFKCKVLFRDGNTFYPYSLDFHNGKRNEWLGFSDLKKQLLDWHEEGKLKYAKMWVNLVDKLPSTNEYNYNQRCFSMWYNKAGKLCQKIEYQVIFSANFPDLVQIPQP